MPDRVRLYRDRHGVPHVLADDLRGAYFGLGYAAAEDRPSTIFLQQATLQGRLAEFVGRQPLPADSLAFLDGVVRTPFFRGYGEHGFTRNDTVEIDKWMRLFDYYSAACAAFDSLGERSKLVVSAFADGVNAYFAQNETACCPEPYRPETEIAWWTWFEHTISMAFFISNAFAVAPAKTTTGSTWIGGDPHYWFLDGHAEAHIICPGLDLNGVWDGHVNLAMWGGANAHMAMAQTAAGMEGATAYRERVNPTNREEYWDWRADAYRPVSSVEHDITILGEQPERFVSRRTHHGPIVAERMEAGIPVAYAVRSAFLDTPGAALDQQLQLWTCESVDEVFALLADAPYIRCHRLIADRNGRIAYACNGPVAARNPDVAWSGPVDGSVAETEWSTTMWRCGEGELSLPRFADPPCGFIQSANDPPWVTTVPSMTEECFPAYVFPSGWDTLGIRGARQRQVLACDSALSPADLRDLLFDDFVPRAFFGIRALQNSFAAGGSDVPPLSREAAAIHNMLRSWDGHARASSSAMTCALHLHRAVEGGIPEPAITLSDQPSHEPEMSPPDVTPQAGRAYAWALERAAAEMLDLYGTIDKPWGEMHGVERAGELVGIGGGCNDLRALCGVFSGWWDTGDELDDAGVQRCNFGSRTLRLTELRPEGISVQSVVVTGQVSLTHHPGSPHGLDQTELFAAKKLKELPLTIDAIINSAHSADHTRCNHAHFREL